MLRKASTGVVAASNRSVGRKDPLKASSVAVLLASVLVLAIFASVTARPAEARGNKTCSVNPYCAAVGWFYPYGERLVVTDNKTDGYAAVLHYEYYSPNGLTGHRGFLVDRADNGYPTRRDLDTPEGWNFSFNVCLWKDGNTVSTTCSQWKVLKT